MLEMGREVQKKLERLYPGEDSSRKYREYRLLQKRLVVCLTLLGIGAGFCSYIWGQSMTVIEENGRLLRKEWGEGSYEITLWAKIGEEKKKINYVVEERQYTDEELLRLFTQLTEILPEKMTAKNESLSCVRSNLKLPSQLDGYPFTIIWSSSNSKLIRTDGSVNAKELGKEGEEVILTATLSCQEKIFRQEFPIRLYSETVSEEMRREMQLQNLIAESDERTKQERKIPLPEKLGEETIIWQEHISWQGGYFLLLGIFGGIAVIWGMNRDLAKRDEDRRKELISHYPEFVSSLQLYMGAGLSLRNAFFKIGNEYQIQRKKGGKQQFLYEEVVKACNHLANGMAEAEVYRKWAKRCDEVHYRKLGYLLTSYSRQGNSDVLKWLGKEVCNAWEECRLRIVKMGEEAETKLLFPMILMLLVVMVLILLPVYVSF